MIIVSEIVLGTLVTRRSVRAGTLVDVLLRALYLIECKLKS